MRGLRQKKLVRPLIQFQHSWMLSLVKEHLQSLQSCCDGFINTMFGMTHGGFYAVLYSLATQAALDADAGAVGEVGP